MCGAAMKTQATRRRVRIIIGDVRRRISKGVRFGRLLFETLVDVSFFPSASDFHPSKHSLPFLPKSPKCLKPGQLAKVIAKSGKVVVGRIRYCGPVACAEDDETYVGLQLPSALGDCDGSIGGKKFFDW